MCGVRLAGPLTARGRNQLQRTDISDVRSPLYFYTVAHSLQTFEYEYNICLAKADLHVLILLVSQFVWYVLCAKIDAFTRLIIAESRPGHSGPVHHLRAGEGGGLLQPLHDARHQHPLQEAAQAGASALRLHVAPRLRSLDLHGVRLLHRLTAPLHPCTVIKAQ